MSNNYNYQCKFCWMRFTNALYLKDHLATHSNDCNFQCNKCSRTFKTLGEMRFHHKQVHEKYAHRINPANRNVQNTMRNYVKYDGNLPKLIPRSNGNDRKYEGKSPAINEKSESSSEAEEKSQVTNKIDESPPKLIEIEESSSEIEENSSRTDEESLNMTISIDPADISAQSPPNSSPPVVKQEEPTLSNKERRNARAKCTICDFEVSRFSNLKKHMDRHTQGKEIDCTKCEMKFVWLGALKSHMIKVHGGSDDGIADSSEKSFGSSEGSSRKREKIDDFFMKTSKLEENNQKITERLSSTRSLRSSKRTNSNDTDSDGSKRLKTEKTENMTMSRCESLSGDEKSAFEDLLMEIEVKSEKSTKIPLKIQPAKNYLYECVPCCLGFDKNDQLWEHLFDKREFEIN